MKKSYLANIPAYLSGPIEYDNDGRNWRTEPVDILKNKYKIDLFDPFADPKQQWVSHIHQARKDKDYKKMGEIAFKFVRKDLSMVDGSYFLIANLPRGVPTTGTHHEIINAVNRKIPSLLICEEGAEFLPIWYFGFVNEKYMFGSWNDLYNYLDEVDRGEHMDDDRWWLTYNLI